MDHIELLLQKGEIPGPSYVIPDSLEFSFMHGFQGCQCKGMPHSHLRNMAAAKRATAGLSPVSVSGANLDKLEGGVEGDGGGSFESVTSPLKSRVASFAFREHTSLPDLPRRIKVSRTCQSNSHLHRPDFIVANRIIVAASTRTAQASQACLSRSSRPLLGMHRPRVSARSRGPVKQNGIEGQDGNLLVKLAMYCIFDQKHSAVIVHT